VLLLLLLISIPAWAEDFRNTKFGMSPQEVQATEEDADWETPEEGVLAFDMKLAGYEVSAGYIFVDKRLVRGVYLIVEVHQNDNDYLSDFEYLNRLLTKKYGNPKESETKWMDSRWKDSPAYHGRALSQGDLSKYSEWKTKTTLITHFIYGKDYSIIHHIDYKSLEMSNVEEEKVLDAL